MSHVPDLNVVTQNSSCSAHKHCGALPSNVSTCKVNCQIRRGWLFTLTGILPLVHVQQLPFPPSINAVSTPLVKVHSHGCHRAIKVHAPGGQCKVPQGSNVRPPRGAM